MFPLFPSSHMKKVIRSSMVLQFLMISDGQTCNLLLHSVWLLHYYSTEKVVFIAFSFMGLVFFLLCVSAHSHPDLVRS